MRARKLAAWLLPPLLAAALARAERAIPVIEVGPSLYRAAAPARVASRAEIVLAAPRLPASARHALGPLTAAERARLESRDGRGDRLRAKVPAMKVGIERELPEAVGFEGLPSDLEPGESRTVSGGLLERASDGKLAWTASFSSEGARAVRLHIREAWLPEGSRVFVYAADGQIQGPYAFGSRTAPEGFWTNTIFGAEISLEVQLPAASAKLGEALLAVASVVHIERPITASSGSARGQVAVRPKSDACFIDASCVTPADFARIDEASRSVGQLNFVDEGLAYACTGGLMSTTTGSGGPYLLTANHCFANQAAATSLEAFWNYKTASCNGPVPNENLFPRTLGSTLLSTATTSDFTLVRLSEAPPDNSVLLGWTTDDVSHAGGTILYRLSYPVSADGSRILPQIFTKEQVSGTPTPFACDDLPQGNFIYEKDTQGGTGFGSSGSPAYLEDLRVVGQELGACGSNVDDDCDAVNNSTVDGSFRVTFPAVQQWLAPATPGTCTPNATTLCLNGGRFRLQASYATSSGSSGAGTGVSITGDSGYFWFFSAANIELVVKVLNACGVNGHFWVFAGGLTNQGVTLNVVDMQTGAERTYINNLGTAFQPLQDNVAFVCP